MYIYILSMCVYIVASFQGWLMDAIKDSFFICVYLFKAYSFLLFLYEKVDADKILMPEIYI